MYFRCSQFMYYYLDLYYICYVCFLGFLTIFSRWIIVRGSQPLPFSFHLTHGSTNIKVRWEKIVRVSVGGGGGWWAVLSCSLTAGYQIFGATFYLEYGGSRSLQNIDNYRPHSISSWKTANFRSLNIWDKQTKMKFCFYFLFLRAGVWPTNNNASDKPWSTAEPGEGTTV
jgi:hypothetical protein